MGTISSAYLTKLSKEEHYLLKYLKHFRQCLTNSRNSKASSVVSAGLRQFIHIISLFFSTTLRGIFTWRNWSLKGWKKWAVKHLYLWNRVNNFSLTVVVRIKWEHMQFCKGSGNSILNDQPICIICRVASNSTSGHVGVMSKNISCSWRTHGLVDCHSGLKAMTRSCSLQHPPTQQHSTRLRVSAQQRTLNLLPDSGP